MIRKPDGKIDVRQGASVAGVGAAGGALWGMLFGLLFLMPFAGMAIGAATGAIVGKLTDVGIDDKFIKEVGGQFPGHVGAVPVRHAGETDRVVDRLKQYQPTVLRTSLSHDAEAKLRASMQSEATT